MLEKFEPRLPKKTYPVALLLMFIGMGIWTATVPPESDFVADTSNLNTGDTAWLLTSSALVLFMTPGLTFFYGGMVRSGSILSTMFQGMRVGPVVAAREGVGFRVKLSCPCSLVCRRRCCTRASHHSSCTAVMQVS